MSILSDFEDRLARAVEGAFAGAFRSPVQPAELARALAHAMDDGRTAGVGKVYAPSVYAIELSRDDAGKLGDAFEGVLASELSTFLIDHARKRGYTLAGSPTVRFQVGRDLKLGRFRVGSEMAAGRAAVAATPRAPSPAPVRPPPAPARPASAGTPFAPVPGTDLPKPALFDREAPDEGVGLASVVIGEGGHEIALRGSRLEVGRTAECAIQVEDANVSRRHAALVARDGGWVLEDLESTNGTWLGGKQVKHAVLSDGDVITVGATRLLFRSGRG